jgi:hypothetical protein
MPRWVAIVPADQRRELAFRDRSIADAALREARH